METERKYKDVSDDVLQACLSFAIYEAKQKGVSGHIYQKIKDLNEECEIRLKEYMNRIHRTPTLTKEMALKLYR